MNVAEKTTRGPTLTSLEPHDTEKSSINTEDWSWNGHIPVTSIVIVLQLSIRLYIYTSDDTDLPNYYCDDINTHCWLLRQYGSTEDANLYLFYYKRLKLYFLVTLRDAFKFNS